MEGDRKVLGAETLGGLGGGGEVVGGRTGSWWGETELVNEKENEGVGRLGGTWWGESGKQTLSRLAGT